MIHPEDMRAGLYVAIRFARQHPDDSEWGHIAVPAVYRVLSVALPYVALECLNTGHKLPADVSVYEFEQLRPEFVAALFPGKTDPAPAAPAPARADDRDEQGYPKPVRIATIRSPGGRR